MANASITHSDSVFNHVEYAKALQTLSFTAMRDGKILPKPVGDELPRCFWIVKPTGSYRRDRAAGVKMALEYLRFEDTDNQGNGMLHKIVGDMPRPLGTIERTFLNIIGLVTKHGYKNARQLIDHFINTDMVEVA